MFCLLYRLASARFIKVFYLIIFYILSREKYKGLKCYCCVECYENYCNIMVKGLNTGVLEYPMNEVLIYFLPFKRGLMRSPLYVMPPPPPISTFEPVD
jgi:hypothetical protein